ncbi:hypothetical protein BCONGLO52_11910 [Brachybacterium conglomeratum]|uniref:Uncharacterized protein n=3 Tax=Dermabacteraceae TaxID=85020 RepID=A0A426SJ87_9MICO|nr:hypothetical protein DS079_10885 [Brachybacterium paraconglomeratum]GLI30350.1 hypothetical protein BCONGLO52_11910 [Brachybacterium conglomeratum]GLK04888.1 hypothetical protein GCM10017597_16880 [Brachybacterium conglomeratum]
MAQSGVYAPGPVIDADVTIRVNGIVREHVSMDWAGDTTGGLPDQVVSAGTGMRSRTGTILWAQEDVQAEPPHPLRQAGGWPPREGDGVVIDATVDTGQGPYQYRRFTGRLGRTTGSLIDGTLSSQITDTLGDALQEMVTVPPMAWRPGADPSAWAVAYRAFEAAGLGHLPPPDDDVVVHYTGQGETSAVAGTVAAPGGMSGDPYYGLWHRNPRLTPASSPARSGRDVLVIARGAPLWASWVQVALSDGTRVRLDMTTAGEMTVTHNGTVIGTAQWADDTPVPVLAFQLTTTGVRVWTSLSRFRQVIPATISRTATIAEVTGAGSGFSARYLTYAATGTDVVASTPKHPLRWFRSSLSGASVRATRGVENVRARQVVDAWGEATLNAIWMDEHGVPTTRPRDHLLAASTARTVHVRERVLDGRWSVGDDQVRSGVIVNGEEGLLDYPSDIQPRATLYQESSARSLDAPEVTERFLSVPSEEEWGPVDLVPSKFGIDPMLGSLPAIGTWIAAVSSLSNSSEDPETWVHQNNITYTAQFERLGQRTIKVTETVANITGGRTVYLKTPLEGTQIHYTFRGVASPTIRGFWKSTWADYQVRSEQRGPAWAEPLVLEAGSWLTPTEAQAVADVLAAEVTSPIPTLSGVQVLWDPTRQIGDVEEWVAHDKNGDESWRARVLVTGYSEAWTGQVPEQSVDVRVIAWTDPIAGKTYDHLSSAYATYAGMTGTYQQVYDALPGAR